MLKRLIADYIENFEEIFVLIDLLTFSISKILLKIFTKRLRKNRKQRDVRCFLHKIQEQKLRMNQCFERWLIILINLLTTKNLRKVVLKDIFISEKKITLSHQVIDDVTDKEFFSLIFRFQHKVAKLEKILIEF